MEGTAFFFVHNTAYLIVVSLSADIASIMGRKTSARFEHASARYPGRSSFTTLRDLLSPQGRRQLMPILHWLTRENDIYAASRTPYRLLEEAHALSIGGIDTDNILVQGDNLEALKALLPFYSGRVKCIYIDPPYNTGSAFEHYDDNVEHSRWLSVMWPRLELLRELLAEDGSIWISIDDNEGHYLKIAYSGEADH